MSVNRERTNNSNSRLAARATSPQDDGRKAHTGSTQQLSVKSKDRVYGEIYTLAHSAPRNAQPDPDSQAVGDGAHTCGEIQTHISQHSHAKHTHEHAPIYKHVRTTKADWYGLLAAKAKRHPTTATRAMHPPAHIHGSLRTLMRTAALRML